MTEETKAKEIPAWLNRVQQESWEPEILLSGLVLIGLIQLPRYIEALGQFLIAEALGFRMSTAYPFLLQIVYILIVGLIVHLFLRSVWVGLVGLSYVFPKGIQPERLKFQPKFKSKVAALPSLETQIVRLEKICSSIFAACFFLMMCILGIIVSLVLFILFLNALHFILSDLFNVNISNRIINMIDPMINVVATIVVLDFVFVGLYRRNKTMAALYYPVHRLIGWLTFSRFYRSIYYVFASNLHRGYLAVFFILFVAALILSQKYWYQKRNDKSLFSFITLYTIRFHENFFSPYYGDRNEHWTSSRAVIPSPVVTGRFLELAIKHEIMLEKDIYEACAVNPNTLKNLREAADSIKIDCVNNFYQVFIDGKKLDHPGWMYYFHQKEKRKGFITFLDTEALSPGKHEVEIKLKRDYQERFARIIFFKE